MAPWNPWKELPGNSWLHATRLAVWSTRPEKAAVVIPTRVFSRAMCCLVHGFMDALRHAFCLRLWWIHFWFAPRPGIQRGSFCKAFNSAGLTSAPGGSLKDKACEQKKVGLVTSLGICEWKKHGCKYRYCRDVEYGVHYVWVCRWSSLKFVCYWHWVPSSLYLMVRSLRVRSCFHQLRW